MSRRHGKDLNQGSQSTRSVIRLTIGVLFAPWAIAMSYDAGNDPVCRANPNEGLRTEAEIFSIAREQEKENSSDTE